MKTNHYLMAVRAAGSWRAAAVARLRRPIVEDWANLCDLVQNHVELMQNWYLSQSQTLSGVTRDNWVKTEEPGRGAMKNTEGRGSQLQEEMKRKTKKKKKKCGKSIWRQRWLCNNMEMKNECLEFITWDRKPKRELGINGGMGGEDGVLRKSRNGTEMERTEEQADFP